MGTTTFLSKVHLKAMCHGVSLVFEFMEEILSGVRFSKVYFLD